MGRKTDRIAALEHRIGAARRLIREMSEKIRDTDQAYENDLVRRADSWLHHVVTVIGPEGVDPRPLPPVERVHWLQIEDGDKLVWKLVSELIALHDREAIRLGEPTWTAPEYDDVRCPDCGRRSEEVMEASGFDPERPRCICIGSDGLRRDCPVHGGPPLLDVDVPDLDLNDLVRVTIAPARPIVLRVEAIEWSHMHGWTIKLDGGGQRP